ncbi:MAG: hypothetical protein JST85_13390 [Acidobacteria bacterium]|nr:hypothetical protein [Acidobacteriota bacterium]
MIVFRLSFLLCLLFLASTSSFSQSQDTIELNGRAEILRDTQGAPRVGVPKKPKLSKEAKAYLSPPEDLVLSYKDFLKQKNTGIAKLLPRKEKKSQMIVSAEKPEVYIPSRYGGASYSFSTRKNDDDFCEEIILDNDIYKYPSLPGTAFWVGGGGADIGLITKLGNVDLNDIILERKESQFLANIIPPVQEPVAREYQKMTFTGFYIDGVFYKRMTQAEENTTYLLRSIRYDRADVLVAFRTIRKESDGSFVILWKMLEKNPIPVLKKRPCYFAPCV